MNTYDPPVEKRSLKDRLMLSTNRKKRNANKNSNLVTTSFRIPLQRFFIFPQEAQILTGKLGTRLHLPANAFVYNSGAPVFEEVDIELKEVMRKKDAVRENLTTTEDGRLLESGGMIYLNASSGGENVVINPDTPITIEMPRSQNGYLAGMDLYTGRRQINGVMNWRNTNRRLRGQARNRNAFMRRLTERRIAQGKATATDVFNAFLFETTTLGWMNCDRSFDIAKEEITQLPIEVAIEHPVELKVVLKDFNSLLPAFRTSPGNYIASVPMNKAASITGYYHDGKQHFFGIAVIVTGEQSKVNLTLSPSSIEDIKKRLKKL